MAYVIPEAGRPNLQSGLASSRSRRAEDPGEAWSPSAGEFPPAWWGQSFCSTRGFIWLGEAQPVTESTLLYPEFTDLNAKASWHKKLTITTFIKQFTRNMSFLFLDILWALLCVCPSAPNHSYCLGYYLGIWLLYHRTCRYSASLGNIQPFC